MSIVLTPRTGSGGSLLTNPVNGGQTGPYSAGGDNIAVPGVALESTALLNGSGNMDRQHEAVGIVAGGALVTDPASLTLLSQAIVLLRAQLLAQTVTNAALRAALPAGTSAATSVPDDLLMQDLIARVTAGSPRDPTTLQ